MNSRSPIRVMHVIARMNIGGPAILVADLVRSFDSDSIKSVLVTGFCDEDEADYLDEVARDVIAIRLPGLGRSISLLKDLNSFFLLMREMRKFKPDVIHTHTAKAGVLGRLAALIASPGAKRVHTFHGHLLHGYFGQSKTKIVILVEKYLAKKTDRMIAIGNKVKSDLLEAGIGTPSQIEVIFPGLHPLEIHTKIEAKKSLGLDVRQDYLVFVGRLAQIKRPDRLLDIARFLKRNFLNSHVLIAGAGELFDSTKRVSENEELPMSFLGWRNDIGRILSASDIAILCSDNEGIPLTLIQASQAGLPIISTDVGSVSDIVVDGETGILTKPNSESLIHAISGLLSEPVRMGQYGRAGKIRAELCFSLKGMIHAHENLYSQVVKNIN